ncbi:MAG: DUF1572 family protein [Acidobacteriota bacterium]
MHAENVAEMWLVDIRAEFRRHKDTCDRAARQVKDDQFFATVGNYPMSIALLMQHLGGNHRSRWRDFLTTDGEKRDRHRDREFVIAEGTTRADVEAVWETGWTIAFESLSALTVSDLDKTVTIRGEPHRVPRAIQRSLTHLAYHSGQIVLLARHFADERWQTWSVAPGQTDAYNAAMRAQYGDWWERENS